MAKTASIDALRPEIWAKELFANVIDNLYFTVNGLMGASDNNIVQIRGDLTKQRGDRVTFGLTAKLSGAGVTGDAELEGQEEEIDAFSEQVAIEQKRNAVRLTGKKDEQMNVYNQRTDAKEKLSIWMQEFIERQIFLKMGGVTNTTLNDVAGVVVGGDATWSNTPDFIPDADTAAGSGDRYVNADASGAASMQSTDLITPALISRVKAKAITSTPRIRPLRIKGRDYFVLFVHPYQAYDLKQNAVWAQAMRDAERRGGENPIFTGALAIWDGVIVMEHEYVPFLDISVAGNSFRGASTGTDFAVDTCRALFCGRQAVGFAQSKNPKGWVEKMFDFENQFGVATGLIGGIQKLVFNSLEYAVIALDTAVTDLS